MKLKPHQKDYLLTLFKRREKSNKKFPVRKGDRFYSHYFGEHGTVTRYVNDDKWFFKLDGGKVEFRAQSTPDRLTWVERGNDK